MLQRFNKDPDSYSYGAVVVVAGTRFVIAANDAVIVDNIAQYAIPGTWTPRYSNWVISVDIVSADVFSSMTGILNQETNLVSVKPGFSYQFQHISDRALYLASEGFNGSPHLLVVTGSRISLIAPTMDEVILRMPLRLIREIALRQNESHGGLFIHAACASLNGTGVLIVGDSGRGKTTTLLSLITQGARFIANDRGVCHLEAGAWNFETWPTAVRVGAGTAENFPNLYSNLHQLRRRENQHLDNSAEIQKEMRLWGSKTKFELTPLELATAMACDWDMGCRIDVTVFPSLSLNGRPMHAEPVNDSDWEMLERCLTSPVDNEWGRGWLGVRAITDGDLLRSKQAFMKDIAAAGKSIRITGDPTLPVSLADVLGLKDADNMPTNSNVIP